MFQRFTDRARKIMALANEQAKRFNHLFIAPEHLLLGIALEGSGVAAEVLKQLNVLSSDTGDSRRVLREWNLKILFTRSKNAWMSAQAPSRRKSCPLSDSCKKVIEGAILEARHLGHDYMGSEHILLALFRQPETVAAQVLRNIGFEAGQLRKEILSLLGI
jgi:ATP-dependent Clp protease ATP-binding subunit ClpC